jgi:hypothetical protein
MSMSKQDFIALADQIRQENRLGEPKDHFTVEQIATLADFCQSRNSNFKRDRWIDYIAGKCGPNGGAR